MNLQPREQEMTTVGDHTRPPSPPNFETQLKALPLPCALLLVFSMTFRSISGRKLV
jgi:hypothetical protein